MLRHISPGRWLLLCVVLLALTFVANTIYSRGLSARMDATATSIAENGAASVVYLSRVNEDIRVISERILRSTDRAAESDQALVLARLADMDDAFAGYLLTPDYPGEGELYAETEQLRAPFVTAANDALASGHHAGEDAALARFVTASDGLADSIDALLRLNADHVRSESASITSMRVKAMGVLLAFRIGTLVLAVLGVVLATTSTRSYVASIEKSKRLADARARELDMFAGRVAHDLRAPLTVIEMKSSTGERSANVQALKDALAGIARQGRRMSEMMDALLTFARSGAAPEGGNCSDIAHVVCEVVAESQPLATERAVEVVVGAVVSANVACSPGVLAIVLSNLVRNAIKYMGAGNEGMRRVTLRVQPRNRSVHFEVEDTGPGLPPGTELSVFEPFVRVARTSESGIGLGLATVKRLVEAHHGHVGVQSESGHGSRFWFDLPRSPDAPLSPGQRAPDKDSESGWRRLPIGRTADPRA